MSEPMAAIKDADVWALEKEFWLGGAEVYERRLAPEAILVLPDPAGVLTRSQTIDAIRQSPRWDEVAFESTHTLHPKSDVVLLAYEAIDQREGARPYHARCASIYVNQGQRWMLVFHQQTPLCTTSTSSVTG